MEFVKTPLQDVWLIKPKVAQDARGFFMETYSQRVFENAGISATFIQDNHSRSTDIGVLRGLHFQNRR